jgi:hypothetical protein
MERHIPGPAGSAYYAEASSVGAGRSSSCEPSVIDVLGKVLHAMVLRYRSTALLTHRGVYNRVPGVQWQRICLEE